jgi:hypothetical protein
LDSLAGCRGGLSRSANGIKCEDCNKSSGGDFGESGHWFGSF